jgi:hypothetical protein
MDKWITSCDGREWCALQLDVHSSLILAVLTRDVVATREIDSALAKVPRGARASFFVCPCKWDTEFTEFHNEVITTAKAKVYQIRQPMAM